jgi:hypothetical protein
MLTAPFAHGEVGPMALTDGGRSSVGRGMVPC